MSGLDVTEESVGRARARGCADLLETIPQPTITAINGFALGR